MGLGLDVGDTFFLNLGSGYAGVLCIIILYS